jgi:lipopolysaccharide assembly outer membrane protein LptD (OstA)
MIRSTIATALVLLVLPACVLGQAEFDISADKLSGSRAGGEEVVVLQGNVRIVHGTTVAAADTGFYEKTRERIKLISNVVVKDGDIRVVGERAEYLRMGRRVIFSRGFEAVDEASTLRADRGEYDLDGEVMEVDGHVIYSEDGKRMRADHAVYHRRTGSVEADGSVVMKDEEYGATITAGRVAYDRDKSYGVATLGPWLETTGREDKEATTVIADSMEVYVAERRAVAIGDVRILREDAVATCGRAVFLDDEDSSILTENPVIVDQGSSLSGETITILSSDDEISQILVSGHAKSIYHPPGEERSELTGSEITLHFAEGELLSMLIKGEANAVFSPARADTAGEPSRNQVSGRTILLGFREGEAQTATVTGGVDGVYLFEDEQAEEEGADGGLVSYRSDSLHYDVPTAVMNLRGGAQVEYRGMKLHSEVIEYSSETQNLHATVEPILWEGNDKITGESLTYNLRSKRGSIVTGRTAYERGLYTGSTIRKTGERALNVEGGTYTSCNHFDPHYSFTSSRMKMYVNDKVITKPIILKVRDVPLIALPFFMFPIKRGRHSGILIPRVEFGFDEDKGRFIRNLGYYWASNDYFDVSAWGDYYENSRWIAHLESRYKVRYLLTGSFKGSYLNEIDTGDTRWDIDGKHTQEIGENGKLIVHADFVSDKQYRQETSDNLEERLRRTLESDISYSTKWQGKSLTVAAERRENLDTDQISQTLPRIRFLLNRKTLIEPSDDEEGWHRGTYISGSSNATSTLSKTADDEKTQQQAGADVNVNSDLRFKGKSQIVRSSTAVIGVRKDIGDWVPGGVGGKVVNSAINNKTDFIAKFLPFGWLNFNPSFTTALTLYDEDKAGKRLPARFMYWGGISSTASIYRTFFPRIGPLQALRHVITPTISYTHRPGFSKYSDRFYALPGISGEVGKSRIMKLNMSNKLQAKVGSGDDVRKMNNLLTLDTSTSYDFLYKDKGSDTPFSTIRNNLRFYPSDHVTFDLSFSNEPKDLSFETLDLSTRMAYTGGDPIPPGFLRPETEEPVLVPEEGVGGTDDSPPTARAWHAGAIFRYTKAFDGGEDSYWLDFQIGFNFTTSWRVEYSGRFDLSGKETVYQEYSIYRDLHCWEARFVRRYSAGDWQYYFKINIKAHPEIYAERGLRALYRQY